jgi:hypothetical protein
MNDNIYVDNIFNKKGWNAYFRYDHGKTDSSDHRAFHYVIGVESPEYKDSSQIIYQEWPVRPDDNNTDPAVGYYLGLNFDLTDPKLGDYGSSDWQIAQLRLVFGNSLAESVNHKEHPEHGKYQYRYNYFQEFGVDAIRQYYNVFDMYPTSDTKYLFRDSTGSGNTNQDKYHQVGPGDNRNITLTSNRIFYPNQEIGVYDKELNKYVPTAGIQYLKSILLSVAKGNTNSKTYDYSFKISNLKPLAFRKRPNYIKTIDDYNKYHNPPTP